MGWDADGWNLRLFHGSLSIHMWGWKVWPGMANAQVTTISRGWQVYELSLLSVKLVVKFMMDADKISSCPYAKIFKKLV